MMRGERVRATRETRIAEFVERLRFEPGSKAAVLAKRFDPASKAGIASKKKGRELLAERVELLSEYQARLAAQDTYGELVVLQALGLGKAKAHAGPGERETVATES